MNQRPRRKLTNFSRAQRTTIVTGILWFVGLIAVLQLWLFVASVNAFLGGDSAILLPVGLVSLGCLGLNLGLLYYVYELDH
ncbi:MAG TPA: hypothetical protein PKD53_27210 [Chloroflexaceae bacterium]|nr:hypothetical protein [Chloroflexaceae bacterium]